MRLAFIFLLFEEDEGIFVTSLGVEWIFGDNCLRHLSVRCCHIFWNDEGVSAFIVAAAQPRLAAIPAWLLPLPAATGDFKQRIVHLGLQAGGSYGNCLLAPNALEQFTNVSTCLSHVELDAFVQECVGELPAGLVFESCWIGRLCSGMCGWVTSRARLGEYCTHERPSTCKCDPVWLHCTTSP
jgi:hypothetical protein